MIKPVNGHILIEPLKHESFIASQKETYEEVGLVVDYDRQIKDGYTPALVGDSFKMITSYLKLNVGDKVFFDSWLAAKYPKNENEYFWLVKWEDVRAIEHAENTIPE